MASRAVRRVAGGRADDGAALGVGVASYEREVVSAPLTRLWIDIRLHSNGVDEPLQPVVARKLVQRILKHGQVRFTRHARDEMAEDGLTIEDIERTPRGGQVAPGEWEHGEWRYRVCRYEIVVVVAFESEAVVIVVTAWRGRR